MKQLNTVQVFESLYFDEDNVPLMKARPDKSAYVGSIKMMDTILFQSNFRPMKWIYTDVDGPI